MRTVRSELVAEREEGGKIRMLDQPGQDSPPAADAASPAAKRTARAPVAKWRHGTSGERIRWLFREVHPEGKRPYSAAEVARWITDNGGEISAVYINKILKGTRGEPSSNYLRGIANFFCIKIEWLVSDDPPALDVLDLATQITLRDPAARWLVARFEKMSSRLQTVVVRIIESLLAEAKTPVPTRRGDPAQVLLARWVLLSERSQKALDAIVANLLREESAAST